MPQFNLSAILCFCFCIILFEPLFASENLLTNKINREDGKKHSEQYEKSSISQSMYSFGQDTLNKVMKDSEREENVLISPLGAYITLSLVHLAAGKRTRDRLNRILKLSNGSANAPKLHETLSHVLNSVQYMPTDPNEVFTETVLSNGLFTQNGFPIKDSYVQLARKHYKANVTNMNFLQHAADSTEIINSWISRGTKNRINNFFDSPLSKDTIAVLTSALYFNAKWQKPFLTERTKLEKFRVGQTEIDVPMMQNLGFVPYYSNAELQFNSIELPYKGQDYAMMIVLPHPSQNVYNLTELSHLIDLKQYQKEVKELGVDYKIPKMKFMTKKSLVNALELKEIFKNPDLDAMTSVRGVQISDMKQAAEIEVDEEGTIATATTAVESVYLSYEPPPRDPLQFYVDRPFILHVIHKPTDTLLFSGIVHKPT